MKELNNEKDLENISGGAHWGDTGNINIRGVGGFYLDQYGIMTLLENGYAVQKVDQISYANESMIFSLEFKDVYKIVDKNGIPVSYDTMKQFLGDPE